MRMFVALVVSALTMAPSFASAKDADKPEEKKICRTIKQETGTRLGGKKVCKTEAQWAADEARGDSDLRSVPGVR